MSFCDCIFKYCYLSTVRHYLVSNKQRTYIISFALFMVLIHLTNISSDSIVILWIFIVVSLSSLRAYFGREQGVPNRSGLSRNINLQTRLELIMLELENLPYETFAETEESRRNESERVS